MVTIYWAFHSEQVSYKRFFELIDEIIAKGYHLTSVYSEKDKKFWGEKAFFVCYW